MRSKLYSYGVLLSCLLLVGESSCSKSLSASVSTPVKAVGIDGVRIAWDYSSAKCLAKVGGYARVIRTGDGTLLAVYEDRRGSAMIIRSQDNGTTWSTPAVVFPKFTATKAGVTTDVNIANPEIIQLGDGSLVMGCNQRPATPEIYPFAIATSRSFDNGLTWSDPKVIYEAAPRFTDGCWEPAFLQLPSGELQVYFANENPFQSSNEQEISMLKSNDNGATWSSQPVRVCYREGRRDGMPVPLIVGDEILVSIEDNNIDQFKPYIVRYKTIGCWSEPVLASSPGRSYALLEPLPDNIYAGAPYIIKIPTGEVILSYQTTAGRSTDWEKSTMEVAIGDASGRNFTKRTRPFDVPLDCEAKWNSLSIFDAKTVLAVASSNLDHADVGVWIKKGYVIPELSASSASISVDGILGESEWNTNFPIFIGSNGTTNANVAIAHDKTNLYLGAVVNDNTPFDDPNHPGKSDGLSFYIDSKNSCYSTVEAGCFKIWCSSKGAVKVYKANAGQWQAIGSEGVKASCKSIGNGGKYTVELSVQAAALGMDFQGVARVNVGLSAYQNELIGYEEPIVNSSINQPNTWCKVTFK